MTNNYSYKNFILHLLSALLIGSFGYCLYFMYNKRHVYSEKVENSDVNILNNFIAKGTKIYLDYKKEANKFDVELHCYSIILILKSLTGENSEELYSLLDELKIEDLEGFRNFVEYLKTKIIYENDNDKIFKILQYFIEEKNQMFMKNQLNNLIINDSTKDINEHNNKINENVADYLVSNDTKSEEMFNTDIEKNSKEKNKIFNNFETVQNPNTSEKIEDTQKNEYDYFVIMEISKKFITHVLNLVVDEDTELLRKVSEKCKKSNSILEKIFSKFLNKKIYFFEINYDEHIKLNPEPIKKEFNSTLDIVEEKNDYKNQNILEENKTISRVQNDFILQRANFENIKNEFDVVEIDENFQFLNIIKQKLLNYEQDKKYDVVLPEINFEEKNKVDTNLSKMYDVNETKTGNFNITFFIKDKSFIKHFVLFNGRLIFEAAFKELIKSILSEII